MVETLLISMAAVIQPRKFRLRLKCNQNRLWPLNDATSKDVNVLRIHLNSDDIMIYIPAVKLLTEVVAKVNTLLIRHKYNG